MKTRCKFQVGSVERHAYGHETVKMSAVYGGTNTSEEDRSFAESTPSGHLEFTITNKAVIGNIQPGEYYYLDLIPCEA